MILIGVTVFVSIWIIFAANPGPKFVDINPADLNSKPKDLLPGGDVKGVKTDIDFGKIPLYFVTNQGQVNGQAKFYAKASRYTLWMTKEGLVFDSTRPTQERHTPPFGHPFQEGSNRIPHSPYSPYSTYFTHSPKLERAVSRLVFLDADRNPEIAAIEPAKLKVNYFIGNDKSKWHCDVPTSMAVLYKSLYKNIDLKVYGIEKQIEYDWIVKPGGNPQDIRFEYKNVKGTRLDDEGNLLIETDFGELIHKKPVSYQRNKMQGGDVGAGLLTCPKDRKDINVTFKKIDKNTYGFAVGEYDRSRELIIDPVVLAFSTYLGGGDDDWGYSIAVDGSGNVYVTGVTDSTNFPTLNQYQADQGLDDVFVIKLDPSQSGAASLLYSTYLGGGSSEQGYGIAVDDGGNAYVTGYTTSTDFPTLNQYQADQGGEDVFVAKLSFIDAPTVTTTAVSNITYTSADSGGNVTPDGGAAVTARGVCWSTSPNPTTANSKTSNGTGIGAFTSHITGLTPGTTYHVRAYATNSVGTSYGSDVNFTTPTGIIVTSPNGGEKWGLGTMQNITWTSSGLPGYLRIELWKANKKIGDIAVNIPIVNGKYPWNVGTLTLGAAPMTGNDYRVKIITANGLYSDTSDGNFSIVKPSLTLTSPLGGEKWQKGTQHNITWTSVGLTGNVKLILLKGGVKVGTIAQRIPVVNGTYTWTVGNFPAGSNYTVKIRTVDNLFQRTSGIFSIW